MSDVLISKLASMDRCARRIREVWNRPSEMPFERDLDKQEMVLLNLQHAIEDTLDCCKHLVRSRKLGWADDSSDVFKLLSKAGLITAQQEEILRSANGMRNIMVHRYDEVDLEIVRRVVEEDLSVLLDTTQELVRSGQDPEALQRTSEQTVNLPNP